MVDLIRTMLALVAQLPCLVANGLDRFILAAHTPIDATSDGTQLVCRHCLVSWPCDATVQVADRMESRR